MKLETVKVKAENIDGGFMIINRTDYNPAVHEIWDSEDVKPVRPYRKKADKNEQ
jgi:hypothetical protein